MDFSSKRPGTENLTAVELPKPFPGVNHRLLLGAGAPIPDVQRLETFSDVQFEIFVEQWVWGYLRDQYKDVHRRGGSGDKGRDVVAFLDSIEVKPRRFDIYQCKHYGNPLTPSRFTIELGKLCHYTFKGSYGMPEHYYIVTSKGIGGDLQELLDDPVKLHDHLVKHWAKRCENQIITGMKIPLEGNFRNYVDAFDFSRVQGVSSVTLLEQHSKTKYHAQVFGTSLQPRPLPPKPPAQPRETESRYISQLHVVFGDYLKAIVKSYDDFSKSSELTGCYHHARESFYSAEALRDFSRDQMADDAIFEDLLNQIEMAIETVFFLSYPRLFDRMMEAYKEAKSSVLPANPLRDELTPRDRVGICHQLVNAGRITWE